MPPIPWFQARSENYRHDILDRTRSGQPLKVVEEQILELVSKHFPESEPVILAGNSIRLDRSFIDRYWPALAGRCHYRMLDVSAWKVYLQGRWGVDYEKQDKHRAVGDILEVNR